MFGLRFLKRLWPVGVCLLPLSGKPGPWELRSLGQITSPSAAFGYLDSSTLCCLPVLVRLYQQAKL